MVGTLIFIHSLKKIYVYINNAFCLQVSIAGQPLGVESARQQIRVTTFLFLLRSVFDFKPHSLIAHLALCTWWFLKLHLPSIQKSLILSFCFVWLLYLAILGGETKLPNIFILQIHCMQAVFTVSLCFSDC